MANKSIGKFLSTYGLGDQLYAKIIPSIERNNHSTVRVALSVCTIVFALLGVLNALGIFSTSSLWVYLAATVLSVGALATERIMFEHFGCTKCSTVVFYIFLLIVVGYALIVSVFDVPDEESVTICLLLCIAPSIMVDRPWRTILAMVVLSAAFLIIAANVKLSSIFVVDAVNILSALALGLVVGMNTQRMRVRSFVDDYAKSRAAKMDGLTGIMNKKAFEEEATCLLEAGITGALLILDADNFKHVNDTYGHAVGDEVIKAIGTSIDMNRRGSDLMGRFGGDEFCVLLVGTIPPETPWNYYNRLTATFHEQVNEVFQEDGSPLTLSCGAALLSPNSHSYEEAFAIADAALYKAKETRGTIVVN